MDEQHHMTGRMAWQTGDTSHLWSVQHWMGYQAAQTEAVTEMRFPGAPDDWPTVAVQQSVAEIKTLKELQEWQLQQCDEFMIGRNPDGETGTPTAPAERT
jgi:hypothetical protein